MDRALAWTPNVMDAELRDAARRAARREGLSIGEWLEAVAAERATVLGIDPADLDAADCVQAVADRLRALSAVPPQASSRASDRFRASPAKPPLAAPQLTSRPSPAAPVMAPIDDRDELRQAEAKLTALFRALERSTAAVAASAAADEPDVAPAVPAPPPPKRSLAEAIAEITSRQSTLDRAAAGSPRNTPPEPDAVQRTAGDLLNRFAPRLRTAKPPQRPEPEHGSARPAMASLQQELAALTRSLDGFAPGKGADTLEAAVRDLGARAAAQQTPPAGSPEGHRAAETREPPTSPARSPDGDDRPDARPAPPAPATPEAAGMQVLEQRLDALVSRIDAALAGHVGSGIVDQLARRLDHVQASLDARLGAPAPDLSPLETMVTGLIGRVDTLRQGAGDVRGLEQMVHRLAAKLEAARDPAADAAVFGDLQAQMGKLAQRIDRSDAGLTAIVSVERSLGELFAQMEETRSAAIAAAEGAARTAARDTLRAAMLDPTLGARGADSVDQAVMRELEQLRGARESSDQRLAALLSTVNHTLEQVVTRLVRFDALQPVETREVEEAALSLGPALARPERARDPVDLFEPDTPLEPGAARPPAPRPEGAAPDVKADPAQFIAAARRAAQAAAQDQASRTSAAAASRARGTVEPASEPAPSLFARARARSAAHRRPLLLSLASLVVLLGAAQVARLSLGPAASSVEGSAAPSRPAADRVATTAPNPSDEVANEPPPAPPVAAGPPSVKPPAAGARPLPTLALGPAISKAAADLMPGIGGGLRDLADGGNSAAQYEVALRLADGRGVARDLKTAASWFEKAARQGSAPAQYRLGSLYEKGMGVPKDPARSVEWYAKAAEAGNIRAMHNLAVLSAEGVGGAKADYARAAQWFSKASLMGVRDSQFNLAILYARGLGIEQSMVESYKWFALAAAQGDGDAAKKRDEVGARLDPKALAAAKAAADDFRPVTPLQSANEVAPPPGGWDAVAPARAPADGGAAPARV